jgi:hypothetical protein
MRFAMVVELNYHFLLTNFFSELHLNPAQADRIRAGKRGIILPVDISLHFFHSPTLSTGSGD